MVWTLETTECFERRRKWYEKKRKRELAAVEKNLNTYLAALNAGTQPKQIKFGFVHTNYQKGICSLTQSGGGGNLAETRLYLFPDTKNQVLWILNLGDKNQQADDVKICYQLTEAVEQEGQ